MVTSSCSISARALSSRLLFLRSFFLSLRMRCVFSASLGLGSRIFCFWLSSRLLCLGSVIAYKRESRYRLRRFGDPVPDYYPPDPFSQLINIIYKLTTHPLPYPKPMCYSRIPRFFTPPIRPTRHPRPSYPPHSLPRKPKGGLPLTGGGGLWMRCLFFVGERFIRAATEY